METRLRRSEDRGLRTGNSVRQDLFLELEELLPRLAPRSGWYSYGLLL